MKHFLTTLLLLAGIFHYAASQTIQYGYVKTRGRLDKNNQVIPGVRLSGVSIVLMGGHSTVSDANGDFSLTIPEKKFYLQSVQKQNYVLSDPEVLKKQYYYSPNPLVITMDDPNVQKSDLLAKERKLRRDLEQKLREREDEIVAMNISLEEKNRQLSQINRERDDNEKIVKQLAEYYTTLDYDLLDEFQRQVNLLLEQGALEKADSLLRSRGNLADRIKEVRMEQEIEDKEAKELSNRQEKLEESKAGTQRKLEIIAADCFNFYQRFLLAHQNDSAAYYLELRANLDTTNVEWQIDAGAFLEEYMAQYDKTMFYYQRALRQAVALFGEQNLLVATCYCNMGATLTLEGKHAEALSMLNKSLEIRKMLLDEKHPDMATLYNNLGAVYDMQGDYPSALEYNQKALDIRRAVFGETHRDVARSYNSLGKNHNYMGNYATAIECFQKALDINKKLSEEQSSDVALIYNNMGSVYYAQKEYDKVLEYNQKALDIWLQIYHENHPQVALAYSNIGVLYHRIGELDKAVEYDLKALNIKKSVYGESHPEVAVSYNNVATDYLKKKDYPTASEYYQKAVDILKNFYGEKHPDLATIYKNMGKSSSMQGDHVQAIDFYQKALDIRKDVFGDVHPEVAISYNNIGAEYAAVKDYDKALKFMQKALKTRIAFYKENNYDIAVDYGNIGFIYDAMGKTNKAVKNLQKALTILKTLPDVKPAILDAYQAMIDEVKEGQKKKK